MPNFAKPGDDSGILPDGFVQWRSGVSYTVRPELLAPLACDWQYHICINVLRKTADLGSRVYPILYRRADALATARAAELQCQEHGTAPYRWTLAHGWFRHKEALQLARAYLTVGLACQRGARPRGEDPPTVKAFRDPGGATPESSAPEDVKSSFPQALEEIYTDFDVRDSGATGPNVSLFSYGEYVPSADNVHFEAFVRRAERRAKFHCDWFRRSGPRSFAVVRREWFSTTNPDLVVVHVYFQHDGQGV